MPHYPVEPGGTPVPGRADLYILPSNYKAFEAAILTSQENLAILGTQRKNDFEQPLETWKDEKDWLCTIEFLPN